VTRDYVIPKELDLRRRKRDRILIPYVVPGGYDSVPTLRKRNIKIEIPDALSRRMFDDRTHGLSHCMKAEDFIVELTDRILSIEIKDPPDPASLPPNNKGNYVEKFLSGEGKSIYYLILVAFTRLTGTDLLARTEVLKRKLLVVDAVPEMAGWRDSFVAGCAVFNLDTWNQVYPA